MRELTLVCLSTIFIFIAGCTTNPVTDRRQLALVPEEHVIANSYLAYSSLIGKAQYQGQLNKDVNLTGRAKEIASRIIPQAIRYRPEIIGWQWDVNVIESDEVNAFCMAGGKIAVYSGLIKRIEPTDDELAQVIGHEIAHALSGHIREKISVQLASDAAVTAIAANRNLSQSRTELLQGMATLAVKLPNSRLAESEADSIGILLAARAGYDPNAAVSLWGKMGLLNNSPTLTILSTHPLPSDRITALRVEAEKLRPVYKENLELRLADRLPKVIYEGGQPKNLYQKGNYVLPAQK